MGERPAILDALFSDETVTVDTVDHNAARTWKFYGPRHGKATVRWSGSPSRLQRRSASSPWSGPGTSWGSFLGKSPAKEGDRQCRHPVDAMYSSLLVEIRKIEVVVGARRVGAANDNFTLDAWAGANGRIFRKQ